jgi:hypothetical protein
VPRFTYFGLLKLPKTYGAEIPARTLFSKKILKTFLLLRLSYPFNWRCNFSSSVCLFFTIFLTCLSRVINYVLLLQYFWIDSVLFCVMHSLSFKAKSFWLVWVYEKEYNIIYLLDTFHAICFGNYMRQESYFLCLLMSPHRKRDGRYLYVEVFSQELEELRQDTFKNGEKHKLGDVKTPLDYTLSVCTCQLFVFLSTQFYRIKLERLL